MVVYLLLVVFGCLLLQLGKLVFLLKFKIETSAHSLPDRWEITQQQSYIAV